MDQALSWVSFLGYTPLKEWIAWILPFIFPRNRHISSVHQDVRELAESEEVTQWLLRELLGLHLIWVFEQTPPVRQKRRRPQIRRRRRIRRHPRARRYPARQRPRLRNFPSCPSPVLSSAFQEIKEYESMFLFAKDHANSVDRILSDYRAAYPIEEARRI